MKIVIFCGWGGTFSPPILKELLSAKLEVIKIFSQGPPWERLEKSKSNYFKNYKDNVAESIFREGFEEIYEIIESANSEYVINFIKSNNIDYVFCIGFGEILKREIIDSPFQGVINIHPGILPLNRGADPITPVILGKVKKAGVTIHYIDEGIDTGKIIISAELKSFKNNSFIGLQSRLGILASLMSKKLTAQIKNLNSIATPPSSEEISKYYRKSNNDDRLFDFEMTSEKINSIIRAYSNLPNNAFFIFKNHKIYIQQCEIIEKNINYIAGELIDKGPGYLIVASTNSAVLLSNIHIGNYNFNKSKDLLNQLINKKTKTLKDGKI